jgi:hypothetical protein
MPNLADALDRTEFVALNICRTKHPALPGDGWGWQASLQVERGGGWRVSIEPTAGAAVAGLFEPVPQWVPPCPVALPACPL